MLLQQVIWHFGRSGKVTHQFSTHPMGFPKPPWFLRERPSVTPKRRLGVGRVERAAGKWASSAESSPVQVFQVQFEWVWGVSGEYFIWVIHLYTWGVFGNSMRLHWISKRIELICIPQSFCGTIQSWSSHCYEISINISSYTLTSCGNGSKPLVLLVLGDQPQCGRLFESSFGFRKWIFTHTHGRGVQNPQHHSINHTIHIHTLVGEERDFYYICNSQCMKGRITPGTNHQPTIILSSKATYISISLWLESQLNDYNHSHMSHASTVQPPFYTTPLWSTDPPVVQPRPKELPVLRGWDGWAGDKDVARLLQFFHVYIYIYTYSIYIIIYIMKKMNHL